MQQTLMLEVLYPYPPERIWHALTDQQTLAIWLMENDFEPKIGHHFQFQERSLPGLETVIDCEVITLEAPRRLVYTWTDRWMNRPSLVTWTLIAVEGGTQLQLHHSGLEAVATGPVQSPVTHLSGQFSSRPMAQLSSDDLQPTEPQLLGTASMGISVTGNWDYRLKEVLPVILAESRLSPT